MILAHIIVRDDEQAMEIVHLLMDQSLLFSAGISVKKIFEKNELSGILESKKQTLIIGKTKSLLFHTINEVLKSKYSSNMPMLYAIPIVYMDEEQSTLLRENTAKV
ncbi:MAG: hypothetical protein WBB27_10150 [Maribacter sp.]